MQDTKIFLDLDGTLAKFNVKNALQRFDKEKGFFAKLGAYKGIEHINNMATEHNLYIISASPNIQADNDKMIWLKKYLPNIKQKNIVLCRVGDNKAQVIKKILCISIDKKCILLDDYTHNLEQWQQVGGIGIKRLTSVADNSTGKWKGATIKYLKDLKMAIMATI